MTPIERRMASGEVFVQSDLWREPGNENASRAIQRWRRRGWISFVRVGRQVVWSLTDAGRAAVEGLR